MEKILSQVVEDILASYQDEGGLNHAEGVNLPSKVAVAEICEDLLEILFPGFHDRTAIRRSDLSKVTEFRVKDVASRFCEEIKKSLRITNPGCPKAKAEKILLIFMRQIPALRHLLKMDLEAAYEGDPAALSNEEILLSYPFVEAISIQRMAHLLYLEKVPILPRMMTEWAHGRTGIDIHPGATIGTHFFIDHGTGVVIGETCRIGNHVKLYHDVTLGAKSFQKDDQGRILKGGKRHPEVGDGVTIYPGSTILGGETVIGAHSTIGGNVFLMQSIPEYSLVYYEEDNLRILPKRRHAENENQEISDNGHYEI